MSLFPELRALVLLRRLTRAVERLVAIEEERAHPSPRRAPRLASLDVADTDTLNSAYRRAHPRYDGTDDFGPEEPPAA